MLKFGENTTQVISAPLAQMDHSPLSSILKLQFWKSNASPSPAPITERYERIIQSPGQTAAMKSQCTETPVPNPL
jgi:hypothetical protein